MTESDRPVYGIERLRELDPDGPSDAAMEIAREKGLPPGGTMSCEICGGLWGTHIEPMASCYGTVNPGVKAVDALMSGTTMDPTWAVMPYVMDERERQLKDWPREHDMKHEPWEWLGLISTYVAKREYIKAAALCVAAQECQNAQPQPEECPE